jgi:Sulfotransferase family
VIAARRVYAVDVDERAVMREWSPRLERARRSVPDWARADGQRVLHLDFESIVGEPVAAVERIYRWLGWDFDAVRSAVTAGAAELASTHRPTAGPVRTAPPGVEARGSDSGGPRSRR